MKKIINLIVLLGLGFSVSCIFTDEEVQTFLDCADRRAGNTDGVLTNEHFFFATEDTYFGDLTIEPDLGKKQNPRITATGLAGADAICQAEADNADLERCYKAVMGDSSVAAKDRLINLGTLKHNRPTMGATGEVGIMTIATLATSLTTFVNGNPLSDTPRFKINGTTAPVTNTWTGLNGDGTKATNNCSDWTDGTGESTGATGDNTATSLMSEDGGEITSGTAAYLFKPIIGALTNETCTNGQVLYCVSQ